METPFPPVQGYEYVPFETNERSNTVCKVLGRAVISDNELRENGPAFLVRFGDGYTDTVFGRELRPWYPT